jgi:DNA repair exonuclease SbcCD nuclease subunit
MAKKMSIMYLGDIHGNFRVINQYIDAYKLKDAHIIQVGDYGVGFETFKKEKKTLEMYHHALVKNNIMVYAIRGNHDFKPYFDNDPFGFTNIKLVKDYTVLNLEGNNILCIGGAVSVDRNQRKNKAQFEGNFVYGDKPQGESWWPDELFELDVEKLGKFRDINIVVTHTAPAYCPPDNTFGFGPFIENMVKQNADWDLKTDLQYERQQLNDAFNILKMNNNITHSYYGHYHRNDVITHQGTKHRLLGVGELWEEY